MSEDELLPKTQTDGEPQQATAETTVTENGAENTFISQPSDAPFEEPQSEEPADTKPAEEPQAEYISKEIVYPKAGQIVDFFIGKENQVIERNGADILPAIVVQSFSGSTCINCTVFTAYKPHQGFSVQHKSFAAPEQDCWDYQN